jgi:hypothetical protein
MAFNLESCQEEDGHTGLTPVWRYQQAPASNGTAENHRNGMSYEVLIKRELSFGRDTCLQWTVAYGGWKASIKTKHLKANPTPMKSTAPLLAKVS